MAWLRIDDSFLDHPKIIGLDDHQLRVHLAAMLYAARYRTNGHIPQPALRLINATETDIETLVNLRIWDRAKNGELHVHDFASYNPNDPTAADRMKRYRARKRNDDRNPDRNTQRNDTRNVTRNGTVTSRVGTRARSRPHIGDGTYAVDAGGGAAGLAPAPPPGEQVDETRPWNPAAAEAWVRNVGWMDPHPEQYLRATYPDIPAGDLASLRELAATLAAEAAETDPEPEPGDRPLARLDGGAS